MVIFVAAVSLQDLVGPVELTSLLRLVLAAVLGATVGWERERHGRAAGLRTLLVLCVGCALVMQVSLYVPRIFSGPGATDDLVRIDPGRIASGVLTGLGFLGAGAIIVLGQHVRGLTTAACVWVVAAIGMAVGCGYIVPALLCHFLVMFALLGVDRWEKRMPRKDRYIRLRITFAQPARRAAEIKHELTTAGFDILDCTADRHGEKTVYRLQLRYHSEMDFEEVTGSLIEAGGPPAPTHVVWG